MSRVRTTESDDEVVIKKTRTRKPRAAVIDGEDSVPKPRKRAPSRARKAIEEVAEPVRKAPTRISAERRSSARKTRAFFSVIFFCLILAGAGVGIGMSDKGSIDVVAVVNERNEKINKGEMRDENGQPLSVTVPVQNPDNRPNGGLQIADPSTAPVPIPAVEDSVATTTTDTASSSDSTADTDEISDTNTNETKLPASEGEQSV